MLRFPESPLRADRDPERVHARPGVAARPSRLLVAIGVAWAALTCFGGAINRDTMTIGSQRFVRSVVRLSGIDTPDLQADRGIAAVSYMTGFYPETRLMLAQFDEWLDVRHEPVSVDPVNSQRAIHPTCARGGHVTAVFWRARVNSGDLWLRTYDTSGTALAEPFRFADAVANPLDWGVAASDDYILGIVEAQVGGINHPRMLYVRWFAPTGQPLTEPTAIADDMGGYNLGPRGALNARGDALIAYGNVFGGAGSYRAMCQIAQPDGAFTNALQAAPALSGPHASQWLTDGSAGICIGDASGARIILQRRESIGLALLEERAYAGTAGRGAAMSPSGRVAVTALSSAQAPELQLFDTNWLPMGAPTDFRSEEIGGSADFEQGGYQNVAIDDTGTVWIVWIAYNTPATGHYLTSLRPFTLSDMNLDGLLNNFDIDPFVMALVDLNAYEAQYGIPADVGRILGDVNGDGALNNFDIDPFVECLVLGQCP